MRRKFWNLSECDEDLIDVLTSWLHLSVCGESMKLNGVIYNFSVRPLQNTPNLEEFTLQIKGFCSREQREQLAKCFQVQGAVEITEWDGVNPIYGLKITMSMGDQ